MFAKAKKLSEEDFENEIQADEWKDELQPEPETQALEVPGEGYQEEFEEVEEELEEARPRNGKHPLFTAWTNAEHELITQKTSDTLEHKGWHPARTRGGCS